MGYGKRENGQVAWISINVQECEAKFSFSKLEIGGQHIKHAPRTSLKVGIVCSDIWGI